MTMDAGGAERWLGRPSRKGLLTVGWDETVVERARGGLLEPGRLSVSGDTSFLLTALGTRTASPE